MREIIYIGSVPAEEDCAQTGTPWFHFAAVEECRAFMRQIRRVVGTPPDGARLAVKACPHDFGTYYEVVCYVDGSNKAAMAYAYRCDNESPSQWDGIALDELRKAGVCTARGCKHNTVGCPYVGR